MFNESAFPQPSPQSTSAIGKLVYEAMNLMHDVEVGSVSRHLVQRIAPLHGSAVLGSVVAQAAAVYAAEQIGLVSVENGLATWTNVGNTALEREFVAFIRELQPEPWTVTTDAQHVSLGEIVWDAWTNWALDHQQSFGVVLCDFDCLTDAEQGVYRAIGVALLGMCRREWT